MNMKKHFYILICTVIFGIGMFAGSVSVGTAIAADNQKYKVVKGASSTQEIEKILNAMAADGWKYHSQEVLNTGGLIFYK